MHEKGICFPYRIRHEWRTRRCPTWRLLYGRWCKEEGIKIAEPILTALAVKEGYTYTGRPGTGHLIAGS